MKTIKSTLAQIIKRKESPLFLILFIACLSLLGWIFEEIWLVTVSAKYIPMAPLTAVLFIILSSLLIIKPVLINSRTFLLIGRIIFVLIIIVCLNIFLDYFIDFPWHIENIISVDPGKIGNIVIGRMSPIAALLFIFICAGIIGTREDFPDTIKYIGAGLSSLVFLGSSVLLVGYLYRAPLLYGGTIIPVAFTTSICFLLFSISLLRVYEFKFWTLKQVNDNPVVLKLLRSFLPPAVIVVILQGFLITNFPSLNFNLTLYVSIILIFVVAIIVFVVIRVSGNLGDRIHKAEEEIKNSEAKLRYFTENSPMAVVEWDRDFIVTRWTGKSEKIFGWSESETLGKPIMDLNMIFESDLHLVEKTMESLMNGLNDHVLSVNRNYRKDGSIITCEWYNTIMKDKDKKMISVLSLVLDISERELAQRALKENERKLHQLNIDKDRFISIIGHDLRSPFNMFLGLSEALLKDIAELNKDEIAIIASNLNKSAKNTFSLLEDLLMWARAQQNRIPFEPQNLEFSDMCNHILKTLNPVALAKNIKINYSVSDNITVFADADMFKTILRNLVSNAIKFTDKNGSINISATKNFKNVTISVSDNGRGIPPDTLTKLFGISEVITTTGTSEESGTGLGLLLCKEFVEKHGGTIWVESEEGKGSTFYFTVPATN